jgi:indole-3-glycerol phosphate synthase
MTDTFVQTGTILDRILAHKLDEIAAAQRDRPLAQVMADAQAAPPARAFADALRRDTVALIAEVKRASPSKGLLVADFDPAAVSAVYATSGAACISVLTDERFFQGSLAYLQDVRAAASVPALRKDFTLAPYQVYEARAAGADAVLLIAAALADGALADLHALALELGMAALVEVHDAGELERALKLGARLVGVNNRDLKTFNVDMETTARLAALVPAEVTLVAESGIASADDVRRMGAVGADAVLVGEALMKAADMAAAARAFSSQPRTARGSI